MNAQPEKIARRKRKTPQRRVPTLIEQPERKPFIFGWGTDLNHREREAVKERIALFAGIAIAVVVAGLLGWGLLHDYIIGPAQQRAADSKPIAQIGSYTVTTGFFKRFEKFRADQLNNQIQQLQQEQQQLNANPTKNAAALSQAQAEISSLQQSISSIPSQSLQLLLDDHTMMQRASTVGVTVTPKEINNQIVIAEKNLGGKRHFQQFLQTENLSLAEFKDLVAGDVLRTKLTKKLGAAVSPFEIKVRASHILVPAGKKALAEQLYKEVKNGAPIGPLAKKYSTDTGSKAKGGDLGYFGRGTMVAPFDQAAFAMKVGEVRLVQSQYGWHVVKLTGRQRMHMTSAELQNAQTTAFNNWLTKQRGILHVQRFVAVSQLPGLPSTTATPIPQQIQQQLPQATAPAPAPTQPPAQTGKKQPATRSGSTKKP